MRVTGEAVAIDLGERGVLFSLINDTSYRDIFNAFPYPGAPITVKGIRYYNALPAGKKAVLTKGYPKFVRFRNMNDPKSVELVDYKDMSASFGEGVRLKGVLIEITDDLITKGRVDKFLPKNFYEEVIASWGHLSIQERGRLFNLVTLKQGETK